MSAFEEEMLVDLNRLPDVWIDRAFWRRRLPPGFRFYLQVLSRRLMLSQPGDIAARAADFLNELLQQRDVELAYLPLQPYLERLKKGHNVLAIGDAAAGGEIHSPRVPVHSSPIRVRCARCGRWISATAAVTDQKGELTHVEGDDECKVIALSYSSDAFGRMLARATVGREKTDAAVNCRSLSYIVDY